MASLSLRSEKSSKLPKPYYFPRIFEAIQDAWSDENPDGFILAAIAENGVSAPMLLERIQSNSDAVASLPETYLRYGDMKGRPEFRAALCRLLDRTTMRGLAPAPENLVLAAGVSSVLDTLFFHIADGGASCLVPAPYYPMFDLDLGARDGVSVWPVQLLGGNDDIAALDKAYRAASAARLAPRALLLTTPDNPTGIIYSDARLRAILKWCVQKRVHCVSDECYCWSTFPGAAPLRSALSVAAELAAELSEKDTERLWELTHVIVSLSKDFSASGARIGGLYTYNADLLEAWDNVAHFASVSALAQGLLQPVFDDDNFIDEYVTENAEQLQANCQIILDGLDMIGIKYVQPQGGFFVWMCLADVLQIDSFEREADMWNGIFDKAKIAMVPGETCKAKEPGWYRVCFASHGPDAMHDFVARLKHFIDQYKSRNEQQSWSTQNFMLKVGFGSRRA